MKQSKVKLILGSKGSGKSDWIYSHFFKLAYTNKKIDLSKKIYLIVPEQDTNDSQRKMMNKAIEYIGNPGILNIDVTSFSRLAHDVFDILNIEPNEDKIIEDDSKTMILSCIISRLNEKNLLKFYKNSAKKLGFARKMTEVVSEFRAYGVKIEDIDKVIDKEKNEKNNNSLIDKLIDIKNIYNKFNEYIESKGFVITEDKYDLLSKRIEDVNIFDDAYVAFDGFTGFTNVQLDIFNKIKNKAKEVYVSIDVRDVDSIINKREPAINGVFYLSEKFAKDIGYGDIIDMNKIGKHKYLNMWDLAHIEKNLYNYYSKDRVIDKFPENVEFYSCDSIQNEILNVINLIFEYIKEGYKYNDIKIIVPTISEYKDKFIFEFNKYNIPLFIDDTSTVLNSPFIEVIRAALDVVSFDFNYESVMRYVNSGIFDKDKYINVIDNIIREYGIRGYNRYKKGFSKFNVEENIDNIDRVFSIKDNIFEPLLKLYEKIHKHNTVKFYIDSLLEFLNEIDLKNNFENFKNELKNRYSSSTDYTRQIKILEKSNEVMENAITNLQNIFVDDDEKISIDEFKKMLDVGLTDKGVKSIPYGLDQIVVGDPMRSRFDNPKIQIFMGLNQSKYPKVMNDESIIDDRMRDIFNKAKVDLSQTTIETALNQRFYTYLIFTSPIEKLVLSYTGKNNEGQQDQESSVISELRILFSNKIKVEKVNVDKFSFYVKNRIQVKEKEKDLLVSPKLIDEIKNKKGGSGDISASMIESYNYCPYKYFLEKTVSLKERKEFNINQIDFGNFVHEVLESIFKKYKDICKIENNELENIIKKELDIALINNKHFAEICGKKYYGENKLQIIKRNCYGVLLSSLLLLKELSKGSSFTNSIVEDNFNGYLFTDSKGEDPIKIMGRVDKLETNEFKTETNSGVYINITDYKSGKKQKKVVIEDIKSGVSIQLVLYLSYYLNQKYKDKNAIFCGSFYFWLTNSIETALSNDVKNFVESSDSEVANKRVIAGISSVDIDSLRNIHKDIKFDYYKSGKNVGKIKKISIPGLIDFDSELIDEKKIIKSNGIKNEKNDDIENINNKDEKINELQNLIDDVHLKTRETLNNIKDGKFPNEPYNKNSCDYCPYYNICKKETIYGEDKLENG